LHIKEVVEYGGGSRLEYVEYVPCVNMNNTKGGRMYIKKETLRMRRRKIRCNGCFNSLLDVTLDANDACKIEIKRNIVLILGLLAFNHS